jgi:hypothetical protein
MAIAIANIAISSGARTASGWTIAIGFVAHAFIGGAFLGRFAVDKSKTPPGLMKGVATVRVAATLLGAIALLVIFGSNYLLTRMQQGRGALKVT